MNFLDWLLCIVVISLVYGLVSLATAKVEPQPVSVKCQTATSLPTINQATVKGGVWM